MSMTKRIIQTLVVLAVLAMAGTPVNAQLVETAETVLERVRENAQRIEDLDAIITVEAYADGEVGLTQRLRLSLLQPDRMRQEYLAPDYFEGNLTLVTGDRMWIYIAATDTWYKKDLSDLSTAEQPWLVFRQFLRDVEDEFAAYAFERVDDDEQYHLVGVSLNDDAAYGRVELWIDPETFVPSRRLLYDVDGNLLVELRILDVEQVSDSTYLARHMETYDEDGERRSVVRYESLDVNAGIDPALFAEPAEADDE